MVYKEVECTTTLCTFTFTFHLIRNILLQIWMCCVCSQVCRCCCFVCGSIWGRLQHSPWCSCSDGTDCIQPGQPNYRLTYSDAVLTSDLQPWRTHCTWWCLWRCQHNSLFHHGNKSSLLVFNFYWDLQYVLWLFPEAWILYRLDRLDGTVRCQRVSSVWFELLLGSLPRVHNVSPYEASPDDWGRQQGDTGHEACVLPP